MSLRLFVCQLHPCSKPPDLPENPRTCRVAVLGDSLSFRMIRLSHQSKSELIAELRREVRAAQSAVAAVDNAVAERLGVNATDHRCLDVLDQRGPLTAGALAEALGLSRSAVTTVLDRLERRRYVRRQPNPDDRRQVVVALTPLLYRRARELYGDASEVIAILGRYSVDDLALLRDFVRWDRELNEGRARRLRGREPGRGRARGKTER
jgi:DNA-binding MarR family transcriptional regulator